MNLMEEHDQELVDPDLKKMEKIRLARLMLRIAGDAWAPPGSFLRAHLHRLDRVIRSADHYAAKGRKQRAQHREGAEQ
jgi:hypothetical protein